MNYEYNLTKEELKIYIEKTCELLNEGFSNKEVSVFLEITEYDVAVIKKTLKKAVVPNYSNGTLTEKFVKR